jgi:hypothetical protein
MAHPTSRSAPAALIALLAIAGVCTGATGAMRDSGSDERRSDPPTQTVQPAAAAHRSPSADSSPAVTASPSPVATPKPRPAPESAPLRRVEIDLFTEGDFVSQKRVDWCVPASILTMANMIKGRTSAAASMPSQAKLDRLARSLSTDRLVGAGSEPEGWAGTLNKLGLGPYVVVSVSSRGRAIALAARALRVTGRPVGLLMWRGAHAWVMSGFEATADPAATDDFAVTHIRVEDSWFPRSSSIWGPGQAPDKRIAVSNLAGDFLPWRRPTVRYAEKDGRFVVVLPVSAPSAHRPRLAASDSHLGGR